MPLLYSRAKGAKPRSDEMRSTSRAGTPVRADHPVNGFSDADESTTPYTSLNRKILTPSTTFKREGPLARALEVQTVPEPRTLKEIQVELKELVERVNLRSEEYNRGIRQLAAQRKELEQYPQRSGYGSRQQNARSQPDDQSDRAEDTRASLNADSLQDVSMGSPDSPVNDTENSVVEPARPMTHGERRMPSDELRRGEAELLDAPMKSLGPHALPLSAAAPIEPEPPALLPASIVHGTQDLVIKSQRSDRSDESDLGERQPIPIAPSYQVDGFDSEFDSEEEDMVYHIMEVTEDTSEEEIKRIYEVSEYPHDDLQHLLPGPTPNASFVNAKPSNQVTINAWITFIDAYFRPFGEEDLAFLRDRGDRVSPFLIPRRDFKTYHDIWAEEDGTSLSNGYLIASKDLSERSQPRGNVEDLNDATAETDQISSGPLLARLLSCLRPELDVRREGGERLTNGGSNDDLFNGDRLEDGAGADAMDIDEETRPTRVSSYFPETATVRALNPPKLDYIQIEERLKQELRHIGVLPEEGEPDYAAHNDDEIAGRLRYLQTKLRQQSIVNGARKSRLMDLVKDKMAFQEYQTIQEDLDGQVNAVFQKRNRTMKSKGKVKRPTGTAGHGGNGQYGHGVARAGIGDLARTLMDRRRKWQDCIGPVFDESINEIPQESMFEPDVMASLIAQEKELWEEAEDR